MSEFEHVTLKSDHSMKLRPERQAAKAAVCTFWGLFLWLAQAVLAQEEPGLVLAPTNQPNLRLGDALSLEAHVSNYTGAVDRVVFYVVTPGAPLLTLTDSVAPFQVVWTNLTPAVYSTLQARASLPDGVILRSPFVYIRHPNYAEIVRPAQGSIFTTPIDLRVSVRVQNQGSVSFRIMSNGTNEVVHSGVVVDPWGLVDDTVPFDWRDVSPGDYTLTAVVDDAAGLPGAISPPVAFVVLDPRTAVDSDRDGMPDLWENWYGLDPHRAGDAFEDADGDGLTNYQEMLAGTDPTDATSALSIDLVWVTGGWLELFFHSVGGRTYHLERRPGRSGAGWSQLGYPHRGSSSGTDGFRVAVDQLQSGDLFRVVLETQ